MKVKNTRPPQWATRLLAWYCKSELLEDLEGDLFECFHRNLKIKSVWMSKLIYTLDVVKFFRLYTIRKPEFINLLINWIMIGSYIKTSGRSLVRNKLFSVINIAGLSISMAVGLLMIGVLLDTFSYDKFHENHKYIYRVISRYQFLDHKDNDFNATTSLLAAKSIKETFAGINEVAILRRGFEGDAHFGEKTIPLAGLWSNGDFFRVFSFLLLQGNPANALNAPFSVVLTEKSANKLFGNTRALGNVIKLGDRQYTVTGIVKDVPKFSHIQFDMLASLSSREITEKDNNNEMAWDDVWNTYAYVLLPKDAHFKTFQDNLNKLAKREDPKVKNTHIELKLQPMDDIVNGDNLNNQIGPTMGFTLLWIFGGLAIVVLLSACFNYTNLSIARSLRRSREVGIRKVIGANKTHVLEQFLIEAIMLSLVSLVAAFIIFLIFKPYFLSVHPDLQRVLVLDLSPKLIICFILFAVFVGISAGLFPALFFSNINAVHVLKNIASVKLFQKVTLRKVLIVFQYCISLMLITGTLVLFKQYKHFLTFDLGFSTENILNIDLQGVKAELVIKELTELPEVKGISQSALISSVGNYWGVDVKNPNNPEDSAGVYFNRVDENYIPLHGHVLLAGTNFSPRPDSAKESEIIVNQQVLKRFHLAQQDPAKAVGEILKVEGKLLTIIGVMKDFQYGKANNKTSKEVILRYKSHGLNYLNVKILSLDLPATIAKIQAIWKKIDPVHPYQAKFYDDQIEDAFQGLAASIKMAGSLAFLAICISSMGLLGMVVFTTETRLKEISIRKVLGAGEGGLLYLLSRSFVLLLGISILISMPITYIFFDKILLPNIANHAPLSLMEGLAGTLAVMIIAVLMISLQTLKVTRTNPAEILKNE